MGQPALRCINELIQTRELGFPCIETVRRNSRRVLASIVIAYSTGTTLVVATETARILADITPYVVGSLARHHRYSGVRLRAAMQHDAGFKQGDEVIQETLEALAAEQDLSYDAIDLRESHPGIYVYSLRGTRKSIALREREIRYAAESETLARFVTPRLRAVFKDLWWEKALVLLGVKNK